MYVKSKSRCLISLFVRIKRCGPKYTNATRMHFFIVRKILKEFIDKVRMAKCLISVILTSGTRKEYINHALDSLINQNLPRDLFEVIIVKAYNDKDIDNIIEANSFINITTMANKTIGEDILEGLGIAKGEIICFMDDDDLFREMKLSSVINYFNYHPNLGAIYDSSDFYNDLTSEISNGVVVKENSFFDLSSENEFKEFASKNLFWNLSRLSIKKSLALTSVEFLPFLLGHTDDFFFYLLADLRAEVVVLSNRLTLYRHRQNAHPVIFEKFIAIIQDTSRKHKASSLIIETLVKTRWLKEYAHSDFNSMECIEALFLIPSISKTLVLILSLSKHLFSGYKTRGRVILLLGLLASLALRSSTPHIIYSYLVGRKYPGII